MTTQTNPTTKVDVYQMVTDQMIDALQQGVVPWHKVWQNGYQYALNYLTKRAYMGINALLTGLSSSDHPYFMTFKQVKEMNGSVNKGAKSIPLVFTQVVYFDQVGNEISKEQGETMEKPNKRVQSRYYRLFNHADISGIRFRELADLHSPNDYQTEADVLLKEMNGAPTIETGAACYVPGRDMIHISREDELTEDGPYYNTFFRLLAHATGHRLRLHREEVIDEQEIRDFGFTEEHLIAEITSAQLCRYVGILAPQLPLSIDSASYCKGWIEQLQKDKFFIFRAARKADQAVRFLTK